MFKLSKKSLSKLQGVHPDLVRVVKKAITITEIDFCILEGLRTLEKQKILFKTGASKTMNSRHLTGHAVDLGAMVNNEVRWDWPLYNLISNAMKRASEIEDVNIEWGGDWISFKDGPHFQLPWKDYP